MEEQEKIDFKKLWPEGTLDSLRKAREQDMAHYQDPVTGKIKTELTENIPCPLCGHKDEEELFKKEGFRFVRCNNCNMVYVNPRLNEKGRAYLYNKGRYVDMYNNLYSRSAKYRQERFYKERMDFIESYFPKKGKLLDIGAARGDFVRTALMRGWDAFGVEISEQAERFTDDANLKGRIKNTYLADTGFREDSFEVVTMWELLEHVATPKALLKSAFKVLKPGGMVFIYVPNFDSAEITLITKAAEHVMGDAHILYFTPKTLKIMVEKVGFETVKIYTMGVDVAHMITNFKNLEFYDYNTKFLEDFQEELQGIFNQAGRGTNLRGFFRKPKK